MFIFIYTRLFTKEHGSMENKNNKVKILTIIDDCGVKHRQSIYLCYMRMQYNYSYE